MFVNGKLTTVLCLTVSIFLVRDNLKEAGFTDMTPVQIQVIPAVMSRRDLIVLSTTGSGKSTFISVCVQRPTIPCISNYSPLFSIANCPLDVFFFW